MNVRNTVSFLTVTQDIGACRSAIRQRPAPARYRAARENRILNGHPPFPQCPLLCVRFSACAHSELFPFVAPAGVWPRAKVRGAPQSSQVHRRLCAYSHAVPQGLIRHGGALPPLATRDMGCKFEAVACQRVAAMAAQRMHVSPQVATVSCSLATVQSDPAGRL